VRFDWPVGGVIRRVITLDQGPQEGVAGEPTRVINNPQRQRNALNVEDD